MQSDQAEQPDPRPLGGAEEQYRLLMECVTDHAIFLLDSEGRVAAWNAGAERILGYREEEVVGRTGFLFFTPEDTQAGVPERELRSAAEMGQAGDDCWLVRKDGTRVWVSGMTTALRDEHRHLRGFAKVLRESEARYHRLLETAAEGIWSIDAQGRTDYVNGPMARMLGTTPEEMLGRHFLDFVFPEDRDWAAQTLALRRQGLTEQLDFRLRRLDGTELWTRCSCSPLPDGAGGFGGALALVTDVTDRRRAEEALRGSEERFRQLAENIREVFWLADLRRPELYVSPSYEAVWGRTRQSVYEQPESFLEGILPEDRPRVVAAMQRQRRGEPTEEEYRLMQPNGAVRWLRDRGFPVRDEAGRVYRLVGVAEDITERKEAELALRRAHEELEARVQERTAELARANEALRAEMARSAAGEAALRRSEERYRQIVETAYEGIWTLDADGRTDFINRRGAELLGFSPEDMLGRPALDFVFPEDAAEAAQLLESRRHGMSGETVFRMRGRGGTEVWVRATNAPLVDARGTYQGALGMFTDITAARRTEQALRESEERFRQLAENIDEVFWLADPHNTEMIYISRAYEKVWGRTCASVYREPLSFLEAVHLEDRDRVLATLRLQREGKEFEVEYRILRPDGAVRWVRTRAFPVRNGRGRVYRIAGLTADVTRQKQAEEGLRERETRLRLVVEQVPAILWTTDTQLRVTSRQGAGVTALGEQPEELNGKSLFEIHETSDPTVTPIAQHHRALRGESVSCEVEYKGRTFEAHVEPFRAADGTITGVIGVALDITERKRAEEALRTAEKRLREAQQVAQLGSWEWDILRDQVVWSDQLYRMYGVNPQEFGGTYKSFLDCVHPEDREFTSRLIEKALRDYQPRTWDCRIVRPDGTVRVIQSRLEVVVDAAGRAVRMVGTGQDVTERKREEELRTQLVRRLMTAQEDEQRRLARDLHDGLGQTLSSLLPRLRLLEEASAPREIQEGLADLRRVVGSATGELRLLVQGVRPPVLDELGLVAALQRYATEYGRAHGITVEVFAAGQKEGRLPTEVEAALFRIAQEALTNAAKHSGSAVVTLMIRQEPSLVQMIVEDDGCGFDSDAFLRAPERHGRLGLLGMQERAALLGGCLVIESRPEVGTTVCVCVPLGESGHGKVTCALGG